MTFSFDIFVSVKTTLSVTIVLHKQLELWGTCGEEIVEQKKKVMFILTAYLPSSFTTTLQLLASHVFVSLLPG